MIYEEICLTFSARVIPLMKATTYRFSFSLSIHVLRQATYCFLTAVPGDVLLAPPDVHGLRDHGGRQCEHDSALFHADLAVSIHSSHCIPLK